MADLTPIKQICERHNLALIEDAAQAHGAEYFGQQAGSVGRVGCFSFYPTKNLGALGEGGAAITNDDAVAARIRALRDHAQSVRYRHEELGFNYRMDGLQAAALSVKLRYLDQWNSKRTDVAARYQSLLSGSSFTLPLELKNRRHVWHLYVVRHPNRDRLRHALAKAAIESGLHYPIPVHLQPAYAQLEYRSGDFPVTEQASQECLSLPMYPELSESEQIRVAEALKQSAEHLDN
jgi:dTDP-4-amino-4,6-dideoxygalactose transaminase